MLGVAVLAPVGRHPGPGIATWVTVPRRQELMTPAAPVVWRLDPATAISAAATRTVRRAPPREIRTVGLANGGGQPLATEFCHAVPGRLPVDGLSRHGGFRATERSSSRIPGGSARGSQRWCGPGNTW